MSLGIEDPRNANLRSQVVVVGFDMPFWPLVRFLVKLTIASIPAGIIVAFFAIAVGTVFGLVNSLYVHR